LTKKTEEDGRSLPPLSLLLLLLLLLAESSIKDDGDGGNVIAGRRWSVCLISTNNE